MKHKLLILFAILSLSSCRSKHKTVEREKTALELTASGLSELSTSENFSLDKTEAKKETSIELTDTTAEEIEADSTGRVSVEYQETPNGYVKTYSGVKRVKVTSGKSETKKEVNTTVQTNIEDNKRTDASDAIDIDLDAQSNSRETESEITGVPFWLWIIVLIIAVFIIYRYKNKILKSMLI